MKDAIERRDLFIQGLKKLTEETGLAIDILEGDAFMYVVDAGFYEQVASNVRIARYLVQDLYYSFEKKEYHYDLLDQWVETEYWE